VSSTITAILVDDEESARDILANLLKRFCPSIQLVGKYSNVVDAVEGIRQINPQIVFLDIEMPNYAGYEIVDFFDSISFEIIFVTAYDQYAVKAFDVAAVDYLLKPIDISRLKQAIGKLEERINVKASQAQMELLSRTLRKNEISQIAVVEKGYRHVLDVDKIVAIEAQESYSKIYMIDNSSHFASKNLKHFEGIFEDNVHFFRTHKSWIINSVYMLNYSRSKLEINMQNGIMAKLSKYRKTDFENHILKKS
jgi:two-component system LytT family response regulator